jgi:DhnA family fructose-bisphosphate aldolase class Ia
MLRMNEFLNETDQRSLLVDASAGIVLGVLEGLEDFTAALRPILPQVEGVVCAPGQLRRLEGRTKQEAGLLMRMDWSNSLRGKDFVLPPTQVHQFPLFSVNEASDFGAVGMAVSFLLGYEEEIEAACMKMTVTLALEGKACGMPLVVEVCPRGPRVMLPGKAVELGVSYALEGGADVIALSYPGPASLKTISQFASVPWLLKPTTLEAARSELEEALGLGCAGAWLDHRLFSQPDPLRVLNLLSDQIHQTERASSQKESDLK